MIDESEKDRKVADRGPGLVQTLRISPAESGILAFNNNPPAKPGVFAFNQPMVSLLVRQECASVVFPAYYEERGLTDTFRKRVAALHESLCIPADYLNSCAMPLQYEEVNLCNCEDDIFGRSQLMTPHALKHWHDMKSAAQSDGIELLLVSAFRSLDYQADLIRSKLIEGQQLDEILKVNAAPGFSEHHTGCALDLTTPNVEPLNEKFEHSEAFSWLDDQASNFKFYLSFPRDNPFGIIYEPWHWACHK